MITAEQRKLRSQFIGSSDCAAILGLDPYKSAAEVWLDKTGQLTEFEGNDATERGRLLEPALLDWAEGKLKKEVTRDVMIVHENRLMCTNFDGVIVPRGNIIVESVEAKTTCDAEGWGEEGTDECPDRVVVQCHHGFACVPSLQVCYVPLLMPGYRSLDFRLYVVRRKDELVAVIEKACRAFMEHWVKPRVRPDDFRPSLEVLKRIRREPGKAVEVPLKLIRDAERLRKAKRLIEERSKLADAALLAAMGDGDGATVDGQVCCTYLAQQNKGYTVEPFEFRALRFRKAKGE